MRNRRIFFLAMTGIGVVHVAELFQLVGVPSYVTIPMGLVFAMLAGVCWPKEWTDA